MTSSIAHTPNGVIPFSQHREVRNAGFGEITYDNTLTKLLPVLIGYSTRLANAETQNQVRYTQGKYQELTINSLPLKPNWLFSGATIIDTSGASGTYTKTQLDKAFKEVFGREAKVGDAVEFVLGKIGTGNILIQIDNLTSPLLTYMYSNGNTYYDIINKTSNGWIISGFNKSVPI